MDQTLDHPVFTAELRPYRSLGRTGLTVMVGLTLAFGLFNILFFLVSGAWPIAFFFGLDIALLYGAFWLSYRSGRAREEVALSRHEVVVRKFSPAGAMAEWKDNPFFSRFDVSRHDEFGITAMRLIGRRSRTDVGSFLNPDDRESFAAAFGQAFATLKRRLLNGAGKNRVARSARLMHPVDHNRKIAMLNQPAAEPLAMGDDYAIVRDVIEILTVDYRDQPSLDDLARTIGTTPGKLQKTFTRWAGLTPKAFLQAVTLDHAKRLMRHEGLPLLEASLETGLSGPGRLHDLFVTHEAMSPGEWKERGKGLSMRYGFADSPFGIAVIIITDRGLAGLGFADPGGEQDAFRDLADRWPEARYSHDQAAVEPYARRIFEPGRWQPDDPVRIVLIGTDFQVRVWEQLVGIPFAATDTYSAIASRIGQPKASRAVGAAVGRNPISFVVPCHRALGKSGALTGYHWGLTRKRAMLGWEAGKAG